MFKRLIDIIAAPGEAFAAIRLNTHSWFAYLVLCLFMGAAQVAYFETVDKDFYVEQAIEQTQAFMDIPADQIRPGLEQQNLRSTGIISAVSIFIVIAIIFSIFAGYLTLVAKMTGDEIRFRQWFGLVCWTSIPSIFTPIAALVVIFTSADGMISQAQMQVLSLNNLVFRTSGDFAGLLGNMSIDQIWGTVLMVLGFRAWTGKSLGTSILIGALPFILIFGIWALIIAI